jgi:hypothetical protein
MVLASRAARAVHDDDTVRIIWSIMNRVIVAPSRPNGEEVIFKALACD